jgi:3-isopropylmalate dehydrogenase
MMLRYSLNEDAAAQAIESAVERVLDQGMRTVDIAGEGDDIFGTEAMGSAVVEAMSG